MANANYTQQLVLKRTRLLQKILADLPAFCKPYFVSLETTTTLLTRVQYAYDLRLFFVYLTENQAEFIGKSVLDIVPQDLSVLTIDDINYYLSYLTVYKNEAENQMRQNSDIGKSRKLASLRTFFKYLYKVGQIEKNVSALATMPKKRDKDIIRLEPDEVAKMLDIAESGQSLSKKQSEFNKITRVRDVAILSLFLGTGLRISELISLNIRDIDFNTNAFRVLRKGGKEAILYFWTEVELALKAYLAQRYEITALPGHEEALFLSLQKKRISVRAVQNLVEKYSAVAAPLKHISPHKLRSTFATSLYRETDDVYLVAEVLGHSDINVTRRYYASISDEQKRIAARKTVLRDENPNTDAFEEDEE